MWVDGYLDRWIGGQMGGWEKSIGLIGSHCRYLKPFSVNYMHCLTTINFVQNLLLSISCATGCFEYKTSPKAESKLMKKSFSDTIPCHHLDPPSKQVECLHQYRPQQLTEQLPRIDLEKHTLRSRLWKHQEMLTN